MFVAPIGLVLFVQSNSAVPKFLSDLSETLLKLSVEDRFTKNIGTAVLLFWYVGWQMVGGLLHLKASCEDEV